MFLILFKSRIPFRKIFEEFPFDEIVCYLNVMTVCPLLDQLHKSHTKLFSFQFLELNNT
jgi:hypothetical protein